MKTLTPTPTHQQLNLTRRMRRLRYQAGIRALVEETTLRAEDFVQGVFVQGGNGDPQPIEGLPGICRLAIEDVLRECEAILQSGVKGVAMFPYLDASLKDAKASEALNPDTLILKTIRAIKKEFPELIIFADLALDPYTSHGCDGIFNEKGTDVDNDSTVDIITKMAVLNAQAGADMVAPSEMMDGRVAAIRDALDSAGLIGTGIMAYSMKFMSAYYGPFRNAVGSAEVAGGAYIDKNTYFGAPGNRRQALLEVALDEDEGADMVMIKPAGPYLDVIREVRDNTLLPVAAYQVSGEYAQIHAAARMGWLDYERAREESLLAIKRAGADIIFTYFGREQAEAMGRSLG